MERLYSKKLVEDYINGNDIEEKYIEKLEKDEVFMWQVLKTSNDKKMYNMCDETLRKNYKFVCDIIDCFKEDEDFICEIGDYYINNSNDERKIGELSIILNTLCKTKEKTRKYELNAKKLSYLVRTESILYRQEALKKVLKETDTIYKSNDIDDLGFIFILHAYTKKPIILKYIAKDIINEIFEDDKNYNLEQMLHKKYKNSKELTEYGITNFIINYLEGYDAYLALYIANNHEIIEEVKKRIEKIVKNWDSYNKRIIDCILDEIHVFVQEEIDFALGEQGLVEYIYSHLNIPELKQEIEEDEYLEQSKEFMESDIKSLSIEEKIILKRFEQRILKIYKEKIMSNTYEQQEKIHKAKIIKIKEIKIIDKP